VIHTVGTYLLTYLGTVPTYTSVMVRCGPGRAMLSMSRCSVVRSYLSGYLLLRSSGGDHCCSV
jgi:hypothetical protein